MQKSHDSSWTRDSWLDEPLTPGKAFLDDFIQGPHCDWATLCARWRAAGLESVSDAGLQRFSDACLVRMQTHDDIYTLLLLCQCLRQMGRTQMALQAAESKLPSDHPELLTCYATLLCDARRWGEAHRFIERALQIKPSDASRQVRYRILAHCAALGKTLAS